MTPISVLIVEDHHATRKLLADCARSANCNVLEASSVQEALRLLDAGDILFLDWGLPNGDGSSILAEWVARHRGPCLVLTGVLSTDECEWILITGANHAILKPIRIELIFALLRRYCQYVEERRYVIGLAEQIKVLQKSNKQLRLGFVSTAVVALIGVGPQASELISVILALF